MEFELFGKAQRFKRFYFDETMMLKLNSFAREVSLQQDWSWEVAPFIRDLMNKVDDGSLRTERVGERRGEGSGDSPFAARGAQHLH